MMIRVASVMMLAGLAACAGANSDKDEDGLTKEQEELLGLDPDNADSDGDGLDDGVEVGFNSDPLSADGDGDGLTDLEEYELGSDPASEDGDGDGYLDFDEVQEGSDPADEDSMIYQGGWPYNRDKDSLGDPGFDSVYAVGEQFPRFKMVDHHGDTVDSYDFAMQGKKIVIDVSAEWCGPCNAMAAWLDGNPDSYYDSAYPGLKKMVNQGDVYFFTILGEDMYGEPAKKATVARWHDSYPNENIPVLADTDFDVVTYIQLGWWPSLFVLDEDMTVLATQNDDPNSVL